MLEMLEIEPQTPAVSSVIWLHGLGADGRDFEPLIQQWGLADELATRFLLPHAPRRPVTLNNHMVMRAWYDIYELGFRSGEDEQGIEQSRRHLLDLIAREEARGIPSRRIVIAGFSQGGALVLHTALRIDKPLAGVLALSAYLPLADRLAKDIRPDPGSLVVRMDHGEQDQVVPLRLAEHSCKTMQDQGVNVDFHRYRMAHGLCPAQIDSVRAWLVGRLARI